MRTSPILTLARAALILVGILASNSTIATAQTEQPQDPPPSATPTDQPVRVSQAVMAGQLISRVNPVYPPEAKAAQKEGTVVLHAIISKTGVIDDLKVISGEEPFVTSTTHAIHEWKYRPYLLNGNPVDVDTTITVHYNYPKPVPTEAQKEDPDSQEPPLRKVGNGVSPPSLIFTVKPQFSPEARKAKSGGRVLVNLQVDANGNPTHIRIVRGVGLGLDEKAIEAVKQYKFKPAMEAGKPVPVQINVEVDFKVF